MNKAHLYSTPSSSKLSRKEEYQDETLHEETNRGGDDDHALIDIQDGDDEDRFNDYYGIVVQSRQETETPRLEQPSVSRMQTQADRARAQSRNLYLKRGSPRPRMSRQAIQRAISPPHSVMISVQRQKGQDPSQKEDLPNYMKPMKKTLIQKELEIEEQKHKSQVKIDKDDQQWDARFWILPEGAKAEQGEEPPTAKLPGVKGKKYQDIQAKVETSWNQNQPKSYNQSIVGDETGKISQVTLNRRQTSKDNLQKALNQIANARAIGNRSKDPRKERNLGAITDQISPSATPCLKKSTVNTPDKKKSFISNPELKKSTISVPDLKKSYTTAPNLKKSTISVPDLKKSTVQKTTQQVSRLKVPTEIKNKSAVQEQNLNTKEDEYEIRKQRLNQMKRARTPKPGQRPEEKPVWLPTSVSNEKKDKDMKRPVRRNSQTFKSEDLKLDVEQKRQSHVQIKKVTNENNLLQQNTIQPRKAKDFIHKNKSFIGKDNKPSPKGNKMNMTDRLKVNMSVKKLTTTLSVKKKSQTPKRERESDKQEKDLVKQPEVKKEDMRRSSTRLGNPSKSKANNRKKSMKVLQSTLKMMPGKTGTGQGPVTITASTARISETSTLLLPTVSTRKKTRNQKGKIQDRAQSARTRMSNHSYTSSFNDKPGDGSVKSLDSNDEVKDKTIEKPVVVDKKNEPETQPEDKTQQPGTARFLSPFHRERVFNNASSEQIERATGIVIRQSRLKQKLQDKRRSGFNRFLFLDVDQSIIKKICQYLHEPKVNLPGQDIWKLSMLSKMHYSIIGQLYKMNSLRNNSNVEEFMQMLSQKPTTTKFLGNRDNLSTLKQLCKSYTFGGSVFEQIRQEDVKTPTGNAGATKANKLYSNILASTQKPKQKQKYLTLRNVILDSSHLLADIYMLVNDSLPANSTSLKPLQNWQNYTKRQAQLAQQQVLQELNDDIGVAEQKEKEETIHKRQDSINKTQEEVEKEKQQMEPKLKAGVHNKDLSHVIDNPMQPPTEVISMADQPSGSLQDAQGQSPRKSIVIKLKPDQEKLYHESLQEKKKTYESPYKYGTNGGTTDTNYTPGQIFKSENKKTADKPSVLHFSSIRPLLNGYGRMIVYEYIGNSKKEQPRLTEPEFKQRIQDQNFSGIDGHSFSVQRMLEGEFKDGQLVNYGRVFDVEEAHCQVGFWKPLSTEDQIKYCSDQRRINKRSVPWGQWAQYQADGSQKKGFEEGIYMGRSKRNPDGFKQVLKGGFASYEQRTEPQMSFWVKLQDNCCGI